MGNHTATSWIPGASDFLGYGVNIFGNYFKPNLKDKFLDFTPFDLPTTKWDDHKITGTSNTYKLPSSIAFSPTSSAHGETIVAESKMKMSEELSTRANAKVMYGGFTGTVKASYKKFNDTEEDRWYCLTDGSQKVYSLHAPNLDSGFIHQQVKTKDTYVNLLNLLNTSQPCNSSNEETYFAFFDWYGTHVITTVQMGGGLHIFTSLEKSYVKTAHEVETSATLEYKGVFEAGGEGGADWKRKIENWLSNRSGSIDAYGGDSGSPLLAKVMSGVMPTTDLSADLADWAKSVPNNPTMVNFKLTKIGDLFDTAAQRNLVNDAYERYAQSYLCLTFGRQKMPDVLEWRRQPVPLSITRIHGMSPAGTLPSRFQGWCVINRTTGALEKVFPFAEKTADQVVPAELKDPTKYYNDNHIVLFSHWEAGDMDRTTMPGGRPSQWVETPFNNDVVTFLRHCGSGKVLQDYNNAGMPRRATYFQGYYVLCGVIGSGSGQGREFTNLYQPTTDQDIVIPLVPQRTVAGFRLNLLDFD